MKRTWIGLALFSMTAVASGAAQTPVTPGFAAFAGCWQAQAADDRAADVTAPRVCVVPTGTNGADLVSLRGDSTTERSHIEADGQHHAVAQQGCDGWESAEFSADGRRLYLKS